MTMYYYEVARPDWEDGTEMPHIEAESDDEAVQFLKGMFSDLAVVYREIDGQMRIVWQQAVQ